MLSYANAQGDVFLSEMPGTRQLLPDSIMCEKCYKAALGFSSPEDESIFGLGQFQDGNFNLKGVSRRLTQVNSQIALPFIFSSKGYGLLWHQYSLTDFNPADNAIVLEKEQQQNENEQLAEVTTTARHSKSSPKPIALQRQIQCPFRWQLFHLFRFRRNGQPPFCSHRWRGLH